MKNILMTLLTLSTFLASAQALADCTVTDGGKVVAQSAQIELTVMNVPQDRIIEVRNDQVSMSVELRRRATAAEIRAAKGSDQEVGIDFDGVVIASKTVSADELMSYGLRADVGGFHVTCDMAK